MMDVLTYKVNLNEIVPFEEKEFNQNSVYLWVLHADKIPPHIGLSVEGKYFSLKSNGKDENLGLDGLFNVIDKKKIKTLLFELDSNLTRTDVEACFSTYDRTIVHEVTCLNPLKDLLGFKDVRKLLDLLSELEQSGSIKSIVGLNIDDSFTGIVDYKVEDIHDRLAKLSNA